MTKAEAWDFIHQVVIDGVNCWEVGKQQGAIVSLAYLTGVIEALQEAINGNNK